MKRHKWIKNEKCDWVKLKSVNKIHGGIFERRICSKCNLEKATKIIFNRYPKKFETFYFKTDENDVIIEGGLDRITVPYGCGEYDGLLLTSEDMRIDI